MKGNVIVTGGAKRGGAAVCEAVHARGYNVLVHCRESSLDAAQILSAKLNLVRQNSATVWCMDLTSDEITLPPNCEQTIGIVANASENIESNINNFPDRMTQDIQTHLIGHLNIIRLCQHYLKENAGAIVAIGDIRVIRPKKGYLTYQIAKGALDTAVRALAIEFAPEIRVNAVSPGPLEWPMIGSHSEKRKKEIIDATPLGRVGQFNELAAAVCFLLFDATFTTGITLPVDGGRSVFIA